MKQRPAELADMDNRSIVVLRGIQQRLWSDRGQTSVIALRLGDVPALTSEGDVEVCAVDGIDVWRDGQLSEPDVSEEYAINALAKGTRG